MVSCGGSGDAMGGGGHDVTALCCPCECCALALPPAVCRHRQSLVGTRTRDACMEALRAASVTVTAVNTVPQALQEPQVPRACVCLNAFLRGCVRLFAVWMWMWVFGSNGVVCVMGTLEHTRTCVCPYACA